MVFGRRREPLANATNVPVGGGMATNDPAYMNGNGNGAAGADPMMGSNGYKRQSGGFFGGRRSNRNSVLTKAPPGEGAYGPGNGAGMNGAGAGMGNGAGMGAGTGMGMGGPHRDPETGVLIPGSAGLNTQNTGANGQPTTPSASTARSLRKSGKMDSLMGTLFCSSRLRMEGEMKQEQAHAMAYQAAELGEADRLEEEARARRERAVAHGAHPGHGALGGIGAGTGTGEMGGAGMTGAGAGAGAGMGMGGMNEGGMGTGTGMGTGNTGMMGHEHNGMMGQGNNNTGMMGNQKQNYGNNGMMGHENNGMMGHENNGMMGHENYGNNGNNGMMAQGNNGNVGAGPMGTTEPYGGNTMMGHNAGHGTGAI